MGALSTCSINGSQSQSLKDLHEEAAWGASPMQAQGGCHSLRVASLELVGKKFSPYQWACLSREGSG